MEQRVGIHSVLYTLGFDLAFDGPSPLFILRERRGLRNPMKSRLITYGLLVVAALGFVCFIPFNETIFALANRNLEMLFVVTNEESGEPIPNASIDLLMEAGAWNKEVGVVHLVTDDKGRVRHVHENNSCEDVIRPFRKTVTLIDLTWASVNVSAEGYQPIEQLELHDFKYDHKGYFSEGNFLVFPGQLRVGAFPADPPDPGHLGIQARNLGAALRAFRRHQLFNLPATFSPANLVRIVVFFPGLAIDIFQHAAVHSGVFCDPDSFDGASTDTAEGVSVCGRGV